MKKTKVKYEFEFEFGFDDLESMEKIISRCREKENQKELCFKYVNREKLILRVYVPKLPFREVIMMEDVESHITYMRVYENGSLRTYLETRRIVPYNNVTRDNVTWPKRWNNFATEVIFKTLACDVESSSRVGERIEDDEGSRVIVDGEKKEIMWDYPLTEGEIPTRNFSYTAPFDGEYPDDNEDEE